MAYLVFDAGGTFTKFALMNEKTDILERGKFNTPDYTSGTKEEFISMISEVIERYKDRSEGIAFSMPGMLDRRLFRRWRSSALAQEQRPYCNENAGCKLRYPDR